MARGQQNGLQGVAGRRARVARLGRALPIAICLALPGALEADLASAGTYDGGWHGCHGEKKVTLCHVPPGHPENAHTITVGVAAISAHLRHGDQLGECPTGCRTDAALCDDGNACTVDACTAEGACEHAPVSCDDGNPCTTDLCAEASGCLSEPNDGAPCNDGNACTGGDACAGTACQGTAIPGCCATAADCDDADACTADACVDGRCANPPLDCTVADKCLAGFCDAATGACGVTPVSCDDANVCTDDLCDAAIGCVSQPTATPPQAVETSCSDGADNDCDGLVDAADPDCGEVCGDGLDNDGDGIVDDRCIGDRVWYDGVSNPLDGLKGADGIQDPDDPGFAGAVVNLFASDGTAPIFPSDPHGTLVASTVTDANGIYHFSNVPPGTYYVQVLEPPGYIGTALDVGSDDTLDSDCMGAFYVTPAFVFPEDGSIDHLDCGLSFFVPD